jgi:hypothetical protein
MKLRQPIRCEYALIDWLLRYERLANESKNEPDVGLPKSTSNSLEMVVEYTCSPIECIRYPVATTVFHRNTIALEGEAMLGRPVWFSCVQTVDSAGQARSQQGWNGRRVVGEKT